MENNKSLIPVNTSIIRIEKQITIGDKILNNQIENLFNEAFYLMNSKFIKRNSLNFYSELLKDSESFLFRDFKFQTEIKDDYIKAIEIFDKIISRKPNFKFAYYFRGIAYSRILKFEKCIADFTKTIELDNKFIYAFEYRARLGAFAGSKVKVQIDDYTSAINLISYNAEIQNNNNFIAFKIKLYMDSGLIKSLSGFHWEAIEDFDKMIEICKENEYKYKQHQAKGYYYRASSKKELFDLKGSEEDYKKYEEVENEKK